MRPLVAHCYLGLSKLYLRTSKPEQARKNLTAATTMYREMDMDFWLEQGEGSGAAGSAQRESGGETVHPTFAHIVRPQRFANDIALVSLKDTARDAFWDICKEINQLLDGKAWTMGTQYTVCDPYAFHFYDVGSCIKLPMHELAAYAAFSKRMLERPAVCKVCGLEENILKGSTAWDGKYYAQPRRA